LAEFRREAPLMITPVELLWAFVILSAICAGVVAFRPAITVTAGGKAFAFLALFVLPSLAGFVGFSDHMERSKSTEFCLTCHVMKPYGQSLYFDDKSYVPAAHFQNARIPRDQACFTCHTDYTMYGDFRAKLRGLHHVYVQYFGTPPAPDKIRLYHPYNNRECLHCHLGARSFEEAVEHKQTPDMVRQIKANQLSCMNDKCHDIVHEVDDLGTTPLWKGGTNGQR
jgi:cytochrome c-type protein NapC